MQTRSIAKESAKLIIDYKTECEHRPTKQKLPIRSYLFIAAANSGLLSAVW